MKTMKIFLMLTVVLLAVSVANAQKKGEKTVVYNATLHCESCKEKIEKNIAFEKGVKNLKVDMKGQTISVTFKEDKNTTEGIRKAIEKLEIPVKGVVADKAKVATADDRSGDAKKAEKSKKK